MAEMHHEIRIEAPPEKVFQALTTREGLSAWWTDDCRAAPRVGSVAEFGFYRRAMLFRMRIDELQPGARVVWTCLGDHEEWKGTRLSWEISVRDAGTVLHFTHGNWWATSPFFASCNSTWGELMHHLKAYAEGKAPGPHFRD